MFRGEIDEYLTRLRELLLPLDRGVGVGEPGVLERDAHDFEALRVVSSIQFFDVGDLLFARRAPGGPELHEDDFSAQLAEVDLAAVDCGEGELDGPLRPFAELLAGRRFTGARGSGVGQRCARIGGERGPLRLSLFAGGAGAFHRLDVAAGEGAHEWLVGILGGESVHLGFHGGQGGDTLGRGGLGGDVAEADQGFLFENEPVGFGNIRRRDSRDPQRLELDRPLRPRGLAKHGVGGFFAVFTAVDAAGPAAELFHHLHHAVPAAGVGGVPVVKILAGREHALDEVHAPADAPRIIRILGGRRGLHRLLKRRPIWVGGGFGFADRVRGEHARGNEDENGKEERKPWEQKIHRRGVAAWAAVQWWEPIPASGPRAKPARSIV